ncbi:hypothetical protein GT360_04905 [Vibrio astriarenae]|uniref:Uncharacterized protein n=1 Tax=Vibrio astriarenae TaxID=1481923 RepID=A0A7Z2T225_9VIBR|nr:hypothetical protein [Vibrio astriarenae]QIA62895.1 hypothetical protein GT360_04905 [Vibrio astriarenae]
MKGIFLLLLIGAVSVALMTDDLIKALAELVGFVCLVALLFLTKKKKRANIKLEAEEL